MPLNQANARGGSSILRHQALCPFRAFASNRLNAEYIDPPVDGISSLLHGSMVHRVLEAFWRQTERQEALEQFSEDALEQRVRQHVDLIVSAQRSLSGRKAFGALEADRLTRLVLACLSLEKLRGPFEVVGFEQEVQLEIAGQSIRIYIDRIDRLPSGERVIIDYKTGKVDPAKWFGARPEDPQLPLYAISADDTPAAVVFTVIRDNECLYAGVTAKDGVFPGLPPPSGAQKDKIIQAGQDMSATIANWRENLHRLMAEFLAGQAAVDPKDGRKTCERSHCKLQSLCRINELDQWRKEASA